MTNSNKSVFIDRNTSHIKHGWQAKRMIMEYNACVSCALIGHNFPTVVQKLLYYTRISDARVTSSVYGRGCEGQHVRVRICMWNTAIDISLLTVAST